MIVGIIIIVAFVVTGILLGLNVAIPYSYSQYIAVAILACLDSVFGAFAANTEKRFKMNVFLSGFFGNAIIAMFLVYIGSKLNVDIYLAAVIVFTGRLLNNFSIIRRMLMEKFEGNNKNTDSQINIDINREKNVLEKVDLKEKNEVVKKVKKNINSQKINKGN